MKKFVAALLAVTLSFTILLANKGDNHNMGLVLSLPHPMKVILPNYAAYNFTQEQDTRMQVIANEMPIKMHAKFDEAEALEKEIRIAVMRRAGPERIWCKSSIDSRSSNAKSPTCISTHC